MHVYTPADIEPKWQAVWAESKAFHTEVNPEQPPYYVLEMLPYPSGQLHMGHVRNYTLGDVLARALRAQGYNVLHPMGWDAFGLPAENAALKRGIHPGEWTLQNIRDMQHMMQAFGWSYDWTKEITTCLPDYYGQQQAIFLDFLAQDLAYRKESVVNWDPVEHTVLANEQVVDGKGWRSGVPVERRTMHQWHFRITKYADELLADLQLLTHWPDRVRTMQENWLGRSEGLKFSFQVHNAAGENVAELPVYTTRPDTIYGATFCAIAPEHPLAQQCAGADPAAQAFIRQCEALGTSEEAIERAEKLGFATPYVAIHPLTQAKLPIYIANFVLMTYGTGAIMAVPAHDERDHAFAMKYQLPIVTVVSREDVPAGELHNLPGMLVESGPYTGMPSEAAKSQIITDFIARGIGERTVNWRLRDWGLSRQRYWGCPIPVVHCGDCGVVPVPKEHLPVVLPTDVDFTQPGNPLERHPTWRYTTCPACGKPATRETDTMDTFVDSSWYFLRYTCPQASTPLARPAVDYWLGADKSGGVTQYIGGIEHAVLHLLYARFFTKALRDCGYVGLHEPFQALLCQGMVVGPTYRDAAGNYIYPSQVHVKDGKATHKETGEPIQIGPVEKISKSKNNGDAPTELLAKYGADTLRLYMLFTAPPERDLEWSESAIEGAWRYLNRVWTLAQSVRDVPIAELTLADFAEDKPSRDVLRKIHQTVRKVSTDIGKFQYNTMVAACMELANTLQPLPAVPLKRLGVEMLLRLLNPTAPHLTEELWQQLGQPTPLWQTPWPQYDATLAQAEDITLVVQLNGKVKAKLQVSADIQESDALAQAKQQLAAQCANLTIHKAIYVPGRLVNIVAS